jgi:two-component system, cell cycle sensor histidine kinase and response regulator CckA
VNLKDLNPEIVLQSILDATADTILIVSEEGQILALYGPAQNLLPQSVDAAEDSSIEKIFPGETFEGIQKALGETFKTGRVDNFAITLDDKNQQRKWFSVNGRSCQFPHTRQRAVLILHDITPAVKSEEKQKKMSEHLQLLQKRESLGRMAGAIAHHFNNLLTVVMGFQEIALDQLQPGAPAYDSIQSATEAANRLAEISQTMLLYTGRGTRDIAMVDLHQCIEKLEPVFCEKVPENIRIVKNLKHDPPAVCGDARQLGQIVENLVLNAVEGIGGKPGEIRIALAVREYSRDYLKQTYLGEGLDEGVFVQLEITDNGEGMSEEILENALDPFFTTKLTGRGLGLASVVGILRSHGGTITLYSEPRFGTTVKILLPAQDRRILPREKQEVPVPEDAGVVLLADDDEASRTAAGEALVELGYRIIKAQNGREAIDRFKENPGQYKLVLLDVVMPGLKCEEVIEALQEIRPNIPIFLCSGYSLDFLAERFATLKIAGLIAKPFQLDELERQLTGAGSE